MDINAYIESGIIESYVMGVTTPEETAEVRSMAARHPEIAGAISAFEIMLETQLNSNTIAPPPIVKERIFSELRSVGEQNNVVAMTPDRRKAWQFMAAASILLFVASALLNIYYYRNYKQMQVSYQQLLAEQGVMQAHVDKMQTRMNLLDSSMEMLQDPSMKVVSMKGNDGVATVYWNSKTKDVYLLKNSVPAAPAGKQYQLWAIVNGKPVNAGMIGDCIGLCKMENIPQAEAFAITLEKEGGSPVPTLSALFVMGKV